MIEITETMKARAYIRRIRNATKREYAEAYLDYILRGDQLGDGPEYNGLSYMAAQSVRIELRTIMGV